MSELGPRPDAAPAIRPFEVTHATVLRLAVPMMLAYLSTPLVGAVGTAVIGQLGRASLLGGIAVAAVIFDVLFVTFNFLRSATTGLTAQAVGAGDLPEQRAVLLRALIVALAAGLALLPLQWALATLGFAAMGVTGEVAEAGRAYFAVRIWSAPFVLVNYAILGWILGRGDALAALLLQTLLNGVNIALSLLFVLAWHEGVVGAAWATVLAEAATAAAGLLYVAWRLSGAPRGGGIFALDRLKRMLALNSDIMVRSFVLVTAYALFTRQGAAFGDVVLAANAVLMQFFLVAGYFLDGYATAAEQLSGRAVGARFRPGFDRAVRLTALWGIVTGCVLGAAVLLAGPTLIDLMTTAPEVREAARRHLAWAALAPLAGALAFQMDGVFIGATWSRDMRNMMILSLGLYGVAWAALTPVFGNHGLWAALLIFLGARSGLFSWRLRYLAPRTFPA